MILTIALGIVLGGILLVLLPILLPALLILLIVIVGLIFAIIIIAAISPLFITLCAELNFPVDQALWSLFGLTLLVIGFYYYRKPIKAWMIPLYTKLPLSQLKKIYPRLATFVPLIPIGLIAIEFYILFFSPISLFDKTIGTLTLGGFLLIFWFWANEVKPIEISVGSDWFNNWERQKILLTKNIAKYSSFVFIVVVIIGFLFSWFNWIQQRKIEFIRKANAEAWDGNYNAAFKSWQDAASLDYDNRDTKAYIMNNLAEAHYAGHGTPKNIKEAIRLWKQAAELGDTGAMCHLAHMYNNGRGVPKDFKKALKFWKKAAELGNYRSLEILEAIYANEFTKDELETIRQKCSEL